MVTYSPIITTMAIPFVEKKIARIINMVVLYTEDQWERLETPRFGENLNATSRRSKTNWGSAETTPIIAIKPGVRPLPQAGVAPHRQLVPPTAASLPRRLLHTGGGSKATLRDSPRTRHPFSITVSTARNRYPVVTTIFWLKEVE